MKDADPDRDRTVIYRRGDTMNDDESLAFAYGQLNKYAARNMELERLLEQARSWACALEAENARLAGR